MNVSIRDRVGAESSYLLFNAKRHVTLKSRNERRRTKKNRLEGHLERESGRKTKRPRNGGFTKGVHHCHTIPPFIATDLLGIFIWKTSSPPAAKSNNINLAKTTNGETQARMFGLA